MNITVPSYVIPGTYLENVRFLADKPLITGIELLFFLYDAGIHELFMSEKSGIEEFGERFSFTVHLPDTLLPEHRRIVEVTLDLADHYIVHPPRYPEAPALSSFLPDWVREFGPRFLLENTRYDHFEDSLSRLPEAGICCDAGHLLLEGRSPAGFFREFGPRIGQIHLHGTAESEKGPVDHNPLRDGEAWLEAAVPFFKDFQGPVELELFSWAQVEESLRVLERLSLLSPRSAW